MKNERRLFKTAINKNRGETEYNLSYWGSRAVETHRRQAMVIFDLVLTIRAVGFKLLAIYFFSFVLAGGSLAAQRQRIKSCFSKMTRLRTGRCAGRRVFWRDKQQNSKEMAAPGGPLLSGRKIREAFEGRILVSHRDGGRRTPVMAKGLGKAQANNF